MDSHRIDVFHSADDDTGVCRITHDLELNLVPAFDRLFNQDLVDTGLGETMFDDRSEFLFGVRDSSAGSAKRVCRTNNCGETDFFVCLFELLNFG